ncbi:hypothetical protein DFR56_109103 [Pseudogracilibacillus auburnensis]|uniref:Uncharacterized protein n=1 Tax=Pseudogracilibacillus auburnensis TaxID=1494959 RepID=A0A2V3VWJ6_9BACI|nr:hypothetical protein DFR56_109103 [Pseudogracilibacillus auburnensis]
MEERPYFLLPTGVKNYGFTKFSVTLRSWGTIAIIKKITNIHATFLTLTVSIAQFRH